MPQLGTGKSAEVCEPVTLVALQSPDFDVKQPVLLNITACRICQGLWCRGLTGKFCLPGQGVLPFHRLNFNLSLLYGVTAG